MGDMLKAIGLGLAIVAVVVISILFATWFVVLFGCILLLSVFAWAIGFPIIIKENGKKTGYIRWFKFHKNGE